MVALKRSYHQADPVTTLRVIEKRAGNGAAGHTSDTPAGKRRPLDSVAEE